MSRPGLSLSYGNQGSNVLGPAFVRHTGANGYLDPGSWPILLLMYASETAELSWNLLQSKMNATDDFEERKKIRARMREIREAKAAEFEKRRKEREETQEDAVTLRLRLAEEQKRKKMEEFEKQAKGGKKDVGIVEQALRAKLAAADAEKQKKIETITEIGKAMTQVYHAGSDILRKAEDEQQKKLKELNEEGVSRTTKTEKSSDGGTTVTSTTVTTHKTKDEIAKNLVDTFQSKGVASTSGIIHVKTEAWSSKDGITKRREKTQAWGNSASKPTGPRGARAAFQQMDKATAPPAGSKPNFLGGAGGGRVTVQRSPSTIKQMLLDWCKSVTKEYEPKCMGNVIYQY
ncbi:hypothetical protein LSH36_125g01008 [Paralvinella palmiformis]|uniref:Smoothelin domain-containing protein n=1 Tax=Paralvinella palmiformis TaxID=53620 RepID=A0AAD9JXK3_9ANNE|nr:hypothetical protein LSH36_125g01008 [Paralvinella palmiformis]